MFLNTNREKYIFQYITIQDFFVPLCCTSVSYKEFVLYIRFLQRDGCFYLTNKFLQVFNNQFVCLVNGRCVNRGEIYLCGGYGIMPERV